jgi:carbonic anhydrase
MIHKFNLLDGNQTFKTSYFKQHAQELVELALNGQHPKALFIGCADSRVVPELFTQAAPGDLFVLRNVGNFVAPYKPSEDYHSTAAGIEYAVTALGVDEIIICGHTHCGAIASLYKDIEDKHFIHTKKWLTLGNKAKETAVLSLGKDAPADQLLRLTEKLSVVSQIENLLTYPYVKERVDNGTLFIHGWVYDIENGNIEYYDPDAYAFKSLSEIKQHMECVC